VLGLQCAPPHHYIQFVKGFSLGQLEVGLELRCKGIEHQVIRLL
jgi:hypothetical protein